MNQTGIILANLPQEDYSQKNIERTADLFRSYGFIPVVVTPHHELTPSGAIWFSCPESSSELSSLELTRGLWKDRIVITLGSRHYTDFNFRDLISSNQNPGFLLHDGRVIAFTFMAQRSGVNDMLNQHLRELGPSTMTELFERYYLAEEDRQIGKPFAAAASIKTGFGDVH